MAYKYFDTIDEEYIKSLPQKFISSSDKRIINAKLAKIEKYKDIDLDSLHKHLQGLLYYIYMEIVNRLGFKDPIFLYKWYVENYDHGIGTKSFYVFWIKIMLKILLISINMLIMSSKR